jgi:hypothetical protein
MKPQTVEECDHHVGYVDKRGCPVATQSAWKLMKKLLLHLLGKAVMNSYILLLLCGGRKISHTEFMQWNLYLIFI